MRNPDEQGDRQSADDAQGTAVPARGGQSIGNGEDGHQLAGRGLADRQIIGDVREDPRDDEVVRPDGERDQHQGDQPTRAGGGPGCRCVTRAPEARTFTQV